MNQKQAREELEGALAFTLQALDLSLRYGKARTAMEHARIKITLALGELDDDD